MSKSYRDSKIYVAGHRGLVGSAICRALKRHNYTPPLARTHAELDLADQKTTEAFFANERPEVVILAAAKVGGIGANSTYPVEFLLENLRIQNNVISAAANFGVQKLVFLGSSCIYPKSARYPLTEDQLLTGAFEPTNEAYALAKVSGIKLCEYYSKQYGKNFISLQPTNLYGPNDFYDFDKSHVIPAMLLKFLAAKKESSSSVRLWGSGSVYREFLHSDDLAEAILTALENYDNSELMNVGSGEELKISELAEAVREVTGFAGKIEWDQSKPDGVYRKALDSSRIQALGWKPKLGLKEGLQSVLDEASSKLDKIKLQTTA